MEEKTAEDVEIKDNELTFIVSFFGHRWNWNIMVPIDKGKIVLMLDSEKTTLSYKIFMHRLFIITAIMSTAMGLVSGSTGISIFFFSWLCGANWVIGVFRHSSLIGDIADKISSKSMKETGA